MSIGGLPFKAPSEIEYRPTQWIVEPWIARGAITELDGPAKAAGKSTWLRALVRALTEGKPFMGKMTKPGRVLYLTEESPATLLPSLAAAGLLESTALSLLQWHDVWSVAWGDLATKLRAAVVEYKADLVVVDTLGQFTFRAGASESDPYMGLEIMRPLQLLTQKTGVGAIIVRHDRKTGGAVGASARGSTAFGGAVDVILQMRRKGGKDNRTKRVLNALSRFPETPEHTIIELTNGTYVVVDPEGESSTAERKILETLTKRGALDLDNLSAHSKVPRSTLRRLIEPLIEAGKVREDGEGKKGTPKKYLVAR